MPSLAEQVTLELRKRGWKMSAAESCTGGMICAAITDLAGSSDVFDRGYITYSNQAKIDLLGVYKPIIEGHGAVSDHTAHAMVGGALKQTDATIAVAVTGIAGPGGGSAEKPVGLVYIGVGIKGQPAQTFRHVFYGDRAAVRKQSVESAFTHMLEVMGSHNA